MTAGKRRTAREMAVQMLYQSDLGGSALPHIFNTFDLAEYMARSAAAASRRAPAADPAIPATSETPVTGADPADSGNPPASFAAIAAAIAAATAAANSAAAARQAADPAPVPVPAAAAAAAGTPAARPERNELARQKRRVDDAFQYAQTLVRGTVDHREEIDSMIRGQADNWRLERMPAVDRNILRLAIYEMLYERETPKLVVVDEAIELAKKFGSEQSGRFVNGLLDGLLKQHTFPGSLT